MNIKDILDKHAAWLRGEPEGVKADLTRGQPVQGQPVQGQPVQRPTCPGATCPRR